MTDDDQVDALLADVARFLVKTDASSVLVQATPLKSKPDSLLVSSHQLVAETEALLSSEADHNSLLGANSVQTVSKAEPISAEKRREIRNAQAAQRRLRYCQKLKNEKETLQQQENQLSQELSRLHQARVDGRSVQGDKTLSLWKAIATRQKERRVEAESQQRQLRAAVVGRARLIHQMNALLQRPDTQVEKNDSPMEEMDFSVTYPLVYRPTRACAQGAEIYASANATVVPFDFEQTCRAMSVLMMTDPTEKTIREPQNTATVKYQVESQLKPGEDFKLMVHMAVRRYREPGRMVFVWRGLVEGLGALSGYHTDETGWLVLRPHLTSNLLKSYVRFVPMSVGEAGVTGSNEDTDQFAEVVIKAGEDEVSGLMAMLENMLIGEAK
ncbi:hypothetical protein PF005_g27497 [Phytophthora fragariae]|uniref:Uncharacterized protein n=1 Tax=Phytophthora fragariae TaxID=53985 RepID=A0A6A3QRG3_9STRA|nr:hypothetical protein PF003_g22829 [Phytophthora fragariae]KAE8921670.1 hypothetical protein PF009_g28054 [Phytophthora fragariae]KAE9081819.1 hypothetical protein PF006_g27037 [Phytophthora fragariae]KAE9170600.1 hypothetical protein PF005_g27497 [Phytophthora fragariae]KAE9174155.1 hypothetical protein PF002_g29130 [Phytophthora fragariae]